MSNKKKTHEALSKPVHTALLKPSNVQAGSIRTPLDVTQPTPQPLPTEAVETPEAYKPAYKQVMEQASKQRKQTLLRTKLRVVHDNAPSPSTKPPCDSCNTSACCSAFLVNITEEEYESGLYGDYAVKLTPEDISNLGNSKIMGIATMNAPFMRLEKKNVFYLEGVMGSPCPLLDNGQCSIYDKRPMTCRTYSCVDDPRITQEMRDGTIAIIDAIWDRYLTDADD